MRSRALAVLAGPALALLLTGCSTTPQVCDGALIVDGFSLVATSRSDPHPALQLCVGSACTATMPDRKASSGAIRDASGGSGSVLVFARDLDHWLVAIPSGTRPGTMTVVIGPAAHPIATRTLHLAWHRSAQSNRCHTWQTVDPVRIALP